MRGQARKTEIKKIVKNTPAQKYYLLVRCKREPDKMGSCVSIAPTRQGQRRGHKISQRKINMMLLLDITGTV